MEANQRMSTVKDSSIQTMRQTIIFSSFLGERGRGSSYIKIIVAYFWASVFH